MIVVSISASGDRGVEKTADEPGPTQPLVLSDLNMRWDLPDHIEECVLRPHWPLICGVLTPQDV